MKTTITITNEEAEAFENFVEDMMGFHFSTKMTVRESDFWTDFSVEGENEEFANLEPVFNQ